MMVPFTRKGTQAVPSLIWLEALEQDLAASVGITHGISGVAVHMGPAMLSESNPNCFCTHPQAL